MSPGVALVVGVTALVGLVVGSFLNVVAHRLPRGESLVSPRSACPHCGRALPAWENLPVLSYLWLGGHCRGCALPIAPHYLLTEAGTAILSALTAWMLGPSGFLLAGLVLTWSLIALTRIDLEWQLLPDQITLPLAGLGLALNTTAGWVPFTQALLGGGLGFGFLYLVAWGYYGATGREGLGGGDLKLLGALGTWIGPTAVLLTLFLAALAGSLIGGLWAAWRGGGRHLALPFGPFLAAAGWVLFLWEERLVQWYFASLAWLA